MTGDCIQTTAFKYLMMMVKLFGKAKIQNQDVTESYLDVCI